MFGESTAADAKQHESSYPEPEGRRIEGGEARDGYVQGSSAAAAGYAAGGFATIPKSLVIGDSV